VRNLPLSLLLEALTPFGDKKTNKHGGRPSQPDAGEARKGTKQKEAEAEAKASAALVAVGHLGRPHGRNTAVYGLGVAERIYIRCFVCVWCAKASKMDFTNPKT